VDHLQELWSIKDECATIWNFGWDRRFDRATVGAVARRVMPELQLGADAIPRLLADNPPTMSRACP